MSVTTCDYCGLAFNGPGFSSPTKGRYCCYGCYLVERIMNCRGDEAFAAWIVARFGVGAFLSMNVMMMSLILYTQPTEVLGRATVQGLRWGLALLATPAVIILGGPFLLAGIRDAIRRRLSMDALICTGCLAAYTTSVINVIRGYGHIYFDTATMLPLAITIGRLIEATAKSKSADSIRSALELLPKTANVMRNNVETQIPGDDIIEGDLIIIRPGERIPSDGIITSGSCLIEESTFTGEPLPRSTSLSDHVYGGSIDCDGLITVRATSSTQNTLLAQIARTIERARREQAPIERLAEKVATAVIPFVWIIAASAFVYWGWVQHNMEHAGMSALAVLVVACPCALGIATPMAISIALGKAAGAGVLIRSGEVMERLPHATQIFFDKTGTLTDGQVSVASLIISKCAPVGENVLLSWAASLATCSEHTASRAIIREAAHRKLDIGSVTDFTIHPGQGISGTVKLNSLTRRVTLGSLALFAGQHNLPPDLADPNITGPLTTTYIGWDGCVYAAISLHDTIRPDARSIIQTLIENGLQPVILSGDREAPVRRLADQLGIEQFHFECGPTDKADIVRKAKEANGSVVVMVGDGINDAPALAEADIGVAIGAGTDLARESGDITLLGNELSRIPWAIDLSKRTYSTIRRNLFWAFGYNAIAVALAFIGWVHPLIAAIAMVISSLSVVANSTRLGR